MVLTTSEPHANGSLRRGYDWSVSEHVTYTPPERMLYTLAYLDERYGGVEQYLVKHGLGRTTLTDLSELLTEEIL